MYHVYPSSKPSPMDNAHLENGRKFTYWKMTEKHTWKMKEWKMHDMKND